MRRSASSSASGSPSDSSSPWELSLPSTGPASSTERRVIWRSGDREDLADVAVLSSLLPADLSDTSLSDVALQVLLRAPARSVCPLLVLLACNYCRGTVLRRNKLTNAAEELSIIDVSRLTQVSRNERQSVCGQVFKRGDLVWTCRQCAKDATCVQCDPCFRRSRHTGHEVYFHRAGGDSGCCDCGDPEAWSAHGNCTEHGCTDSSRDPSAAVDLALQRGLRAVLRALLAFATHYATLTVRGYESLDHNLLFQALSSADSEGGEGEASEKRERAGRVVVRVHNDDVHTFQQVTAALMAAGVSATQAGRLTDEIDKDGSARIDTLSLCSSVPREREAGIEKAHKLFAVLGGPGASPTQRESQREGAGLLVSLFPEALLARESSLCDALQWALSLGRGSDGLRRIVTQEMLREVSEEECAYVHALSLLPEIERDSQTAHTATPHTSLWRLRDVFCESDQFPSHISQLRSVNSLSLSLSARCSVVVTESPDTGAHALPRTLTDGELAERDFKTRCVSPLRTVRPTLLGVLSLSSPYLSLPLKRFLHSLVMHFQHDALFKASFAQIITCLYPSLSMLYCVRHIGVSDDSLFRTTVQLFTAQSVARLLSCEGAIAGERPLAERVWRDGELCDAMTQRTLASSHTSETAESVSKEYVTITGMLGNALFSVLRALGLTERDFAAERDREARLSHAIESGENLRRVIAPLENTPEREFLEHHSVRTNRLSIICRDIEYLLGTPGLYCAKLLKGDLNAGTLEAWLDVCRLAQEMDKHKRYTRAHVEIESDLWQYAANLALEIETVTTQMMCGALLDASLSSIDNEFHSQTNTASVNAQNDEDDATLSVQDTHVLRTFAVETAIEKIVQRLLSLYVQSAFAYSEKEADRPVTLYTRTPVLSMVPFSVSRGFVSVHLPLHRLLHKTIFYAAQGGLSLENVFSTVLRSLSGAEKRVLLDFPLRALVFAAQSDAGLWVRNGQAVANIAYNYQRVPLSRAMRDLDVCALQVALLIAQSSAHTQSNAQANTEAMEMDDLSDSSSSHVMHKTAMDHVLLFVLERFEVLSLLETLRPRTNEDLREKRDVLLGECLRLLIHTVTRLPVALVKPPHNTQDEVEGVELALCREIAHRALYTPQATLSALSSVKALVGSHTTVSDALLARAVETVCVRRERAGSSASAEEETNAFLSLREDAFRLIDPEFSNTSRKHAFVVLDRLRERLQSLGAQKLAKLNESTPYKGNPYAPIVCIDALPIPHRDFLSVREILGSECVCEILLRVLRLCSEKESEISGESTREGEKNNGVGLVARAVHLVTLQIHFHTLAAQRVERLTPAHTSHAEAQSHAAALSLSAVYREDNEIGWALLGALCDVWRRETLREDVLYHQGLAFVLHHLATSLPHTQSYLRECGFTVQSEGGGDTSAAEDEEARRKARREAQQRALEEEKRRAAAALSALCGEMSSDEEDEEEEDERTHHAHTEHTSPKSEDENEFLRGSAFIGKHRRLDRETCIVCRERTDQPIGLLCLVQNSNVTKNAIIAQQCEDLPIMRKLHRVVVLAGCVVRTEPSHSSPNAQTVGVVPYGDTVTVEERRGLWVRVSAPFNGWMPLAIRVRVPQSTRTQLSATGIHPMVKHSQGARRTLAPVLDLVFNKNGGTRVHVSSCGHAMHLDCWDMVHSAAYARMLNNPRSAESLAFDARNGECLCPLCKSVCNAVLPCVPLDARNETGENDSAQPLSSLSALITATQRENALSEEELLSKLAVNLCAHTRGGDNAVEQGSEEGSARSAQRGADTRFFSLVHSQQLSLNPLQKNALSGELSLADFHSRCNGNVSAQRTFLSALSTAAYTLASLSRRLLRASILDKTPNEGNIDGMGGLSLSEWRGSESETHFARALLGLTTRAHNVFSSESAFFRDRLLVLPALAILCGTGLSSVLRQTGQSPSVSTADAATVAQWTHTLRSLPWHAVHSADYPDWPSVLETARQASQACGESCVSELCGGLFAQSPLLSQDLSLWAVLCVALFPQDNNNNNTGEQSLGALHTAVCLTVAAKVVQTLLEPAATGLLNQVSQGDEAHNKRQKTTPSKETDSVSLSCKETGEALLSLQKELCAAAHTPLFTDTEVHRDTHASRLSMLVADAVFPFLDLLCRLHDWADLPVRYRLLCRARENYRSKESEIDWTENASLLLRALGVASSLADLARAEWVRCVGVRWARDFGAHYRHHTTSSHNAEESEGEKEVRWVPEVHTHDLTHAASIAENAENTETEDEEAMSIASDREGPVSLTDIEELLTDPLSRTHPPHITQLLQTVRTMLRERGVDPDALVAGAPTDTDPQTATDLALLGPALNALTHLAQHTAEGENEGEGDFDSDEDSHTHRDRHSVADSETSWWRTYGVLPAHALGDELSPSDYRSLRPILSSHRTPLQGSLTGSAVVLSLKGSPLKYTFPDWSHNALSLRHLLRPCLVPLPTHYTDLYHKTKFPEGPQGVTLDEPTLCLVCGQVLNAGKRVHTGTDSAANPGECHLHSERCGAGCGVFFLVQQCAVLLTRGSRAIYFPSLYLDETGEISESRHQNRPLYLSVKRYRKLEELYLSHQIAREVVAKRMTADTVIRQFWH